MTHDSVLSNTPNLADLLVEAVQMLRHVVQNLVVLHDKRFPDLNLQTQNSSNHTKKREEPEETQLIKSRERRRNPMVKKTYSEWVNKRSR